MDVDRPTQLLKASLPKGNNSHGEKKLKHKGISED